ncbi:MAG: mechanosensitive ion channel family protein [Deltaproteobacteria bacterium]|nr:mechanosensitive ion channel family protein [Deltaproteobacteria bacterium]
MFKRSVIISMGLFIFLLGPMYTGSYEQAIAQKTLETPVNNDVMKELASEKVGVDASELLEHINATVKDGKRYINTMKTASDEDLLVLQLQFFSLQQRMINDVHKLTDAMLDQEKKGKQPELRREVEAVLTRITPSLWIHINRLRGEVDAVRARRIKAPVKERLAIENEVLKLTARLDKMYEMSLSHIEKMDQAGMDTGRARANLTKLLAERADELYGRIALAIDRFDDLETRRKEIPDDADVTMLLIAAAKSLNTNTASMEVSLGLMETLKMDTNVYRTQLIQATKDITSGLFDTGVAVSILGHAMKRVTSWIFDKGPKVFLKLLLFFGILFFFSFAKRIVRAGLERALDASNLNLSQLARRMIVSAVSNLVFIFGLLIALSQLGISLGPLLAGLGVAGFIVGFALQDTLSNFASGIMILLYRPYDVGDLIDVGGVFGKVDKMNLVSTSILTLDNQMIVIPNNKIWGDVIKNITAQDIRRVDMVFGIAYSDDVSKAETILNDILKSHDKILDDPEPMVRLHTLGESSVDFVVRPWVKFDDYWDVYWHVTKAVKLRFDEDGISIPFPQRDVHVYNNSIATAGAGIA